MKEMRGWGWGHSCKDHEREIAPDLVSGCIQLCVQYWPVFLSCRQLACAQSEKRSELWVRTLKTPGHEMSKVLDTGRPLRGGRV